MKKILLLLGVMAMFVSLQSQEFLTPNPYKEWKPVQYRLEWPSTPNLKYRLFKAGQGMNDEYWLKNTNTGVWASVVQTNKEFSPFYPITSDYTTNKTMVLQGKSQAAVKWYVVEVSTNNVMYRTSNIVSWPTNWTTLSTNGFALKLVRLPVGPPMFINHNPPRPPQSSSVVVK